MKIFAYALREYDEQTYFEEIGKRLGVTFGFTSQYPTMENTNLAEGYDALSIITNPMYPELLEQYHAMGIRYISTRSIGYDHIDVACAKKLGIKIAHVSYDPNSVANYTIMMMLMGCRKIMHIMKRADVQDFGLKGKAGREFSNCTIGVVGTGRIGMRVIRHLSGFGVNILAYDLYPNDVAQQYAKYTDLDTLYKESDIITLHAPGSEENYHMINADTFAKMKDGVMLINNARGSLIDTEAMIASLKSGKIGFAGLDTIENESGLYYLNREGDQIDNDERAILQSFPNVLLSPHTAFYTEQAVEDMVGNSIQGLLNFETEGPNEFEVK